MTKSKLFLDFYIILISLFAFSALMATDSVANEKKEIGEVYNVYFSVYSKKINETEDDSLNSGGSRIIYENILSGENNYELKYSEDIFQNFGEQVSPYVFHNGETKHSIKLKIEKDKFEDGAYLDIDLKWWRDLDKKIYSSISFKERLYFTNKQMKYNPTVTKCKNLFFKGKTLVNSYYICVTKK